MGGFSDFMIGTRGGIRQAPTMGGNQLGLQGQAINQAMSGLQGMQNRGPMNFEPIAQQARTQFQGQTIPMLAERFASMGPAGSQGGVRSGAFAGTMGAAGSQLEESLAALKEQYGLQERGQEQNWMQSLMGTGMRPQFENYAQPAQEGLLQQFIKHILMGGQGGQQGGGQGGKQGVGMEELVKLFGLMAGM